MTAGQGTALSTADRAEIIRLFARYTLAEDSGETARYAALFTADGSLAGRGDQLVTGRAALEAYAADRWENRRQVRGHTHWTSNISLNPTADGGATAISYLMVVQAQGDDFSVTEVSGRRDVLRREDGRWLFQERRVLPVAELTHEPA
jgi:hypothetical protein